MSFRWPDPGVCLGDHRLHGCVRWGLSEGYGHDGPGVCLDDGQTEAYLKDAGMTGLASAWAMSERVPSQGGHGDALLRRMQSYLPELLNILKSFRISCTSYTLKQYMFYKNELHT